MILVDYFSYFVVICSHMVLPGVHRNGSCNFKLLVSSQVIGLGTPDLHSTESDTDKTKKCRPTLRIVTFSTLTLNSYQAPS
jgi:hypothetical protein